MQRAVGIERSQRCWIGRDVADVGEAEVAGQRIAVLQRLLEMLSGVEEEDRQRLVDAGDDVEKNRRIRAEG